MKLKVPDSVRLFGVEHKVKMVKDMARDKAVNGYYITQSREIHISKDLEPQETMAVFLHEVVEGIVINLEMEIEHSDITRFGTAIYQILADNLDRMICD